MMDRYVTITLLPDEAGLAEAAGILASGGLVAFPTETVYGLGGDARNADAVAGIFAAKGRPSKNPLIVHVADLDMAERLVMLSDEGRALARAFWPGPLTLVAPVRPDAGIAAAVRAAQPTLAVRVPAHPVAHGLLAASGLPLAGPSANRSGRVSPTSAAHVLSELDGRIPAVIDAGACPVGIESTIVGVDGPPRLLRHGGLPLPVIEACLGTALPGAVPVTDTPTAPGQLASHYAPEADLRLNANAPRPGEVLPGFGPIEGAELNLSPAGDLAEAAARLFDCLRRLDAAGHARVAVSPIPDVGLGAAINDRLRRAAAPRS